MGERSLLRRMFRAARIDSELFEEVEAEPRAIRQALVVVLLTCAAGAAGSWLAGRPPFVMATDLVEPIMVWLGGGAFTYMVGATFLRGPETVTSYTEVLRTTGFAFTPGLLRIAIALPPHGLGLGLTMLSDVWVLVAGIVAVRQALDFTTVACDRNVRRVLPAAVADLRRAAARHHGAQPLITGARGSIRARRGCGRCAPARFFGDGGLSAGAPSAATLSAARAMPSSRSRLRAPAMVKRSS